MKKQFNPNKIYTRHIRTERYGGITVCGKFDIVEGEIQKFRIGIGFCSPEEKSFNKKLGRLIALGRLKAKRERGYIELGFDKDIPKLAEFPSEEVWKCMEYSLGALWKKGTKAKDKYVPRWFYAFMPKIMMDGIVDRERMSECLHIGEKG